MGHMSPIDLKFPLLGEHEKEEEKRKFKKYASNKINTIKLKYFLNLIIKKNTFSLQTEIYFKNKFFIHNHGYHLVK